MVLTITLFATSGNGTLAPWDATQKLVVRGVYRHVRNPMIGGVFCILLGESLALGSVTLFCWFAVFVLGNLVYIPLVEEPGLQGRFGQAYERYRKHVPRWIPRPKPWMPPARPAQPEAASRESMRIHVSQCLPQNVILLRRNEELPNRYEVEMHGLDRLRSYDRVECDVVFYPYSRTICSDNIHFYPFEEYVDDVLSNQRSAYAEIVSPWNQLFGLALGLLIALIFAFLHPASLLDIEAIVSVFGAYVIGKELWDDIERLLVNATKNWRLRYQESYYRYRLEKRTTLTYYSYLAKRRRYGKATLLPEKIDLIQQSNSQTLRMCFDTRDWDSLQKLQAPADEGRRDPDTPELATAHIHSMPTLRGPWTQTW